MSFSTVSISDLKRANIDSLAYGVVKMDHSGKVVDYNKNQSDHTGMSKSAVLGQHFFTQVAPCTNNFLVAQKFENASTLDEELSYTFTIKMAPTLVTLRLLKDSSEQYLLCNW